MATRARPSVLLIREWEHQIGASSCGSAPDGSALGESQLYPQRRERMESMGPLYRSIVERYGNDVDVQVVDPRNMLTLLPMLIRDLRAHGGGVIQALRTLRRLTFQTVVVNGRILSRGQWPEPDTVFSILDSLLARREARQP
jgi:hypothetical protein